MGRTGEAELTYQDFWMQRPFLQANSVSGSQVREWQMAVSSSLPSRQSLSPSHFHVPKIHRPVELHLNWYAPNEEKIALPRLHKETNQASRCLVRRLHRYKKIAKEVNDDVEEERKSQKEKKRSRDRPRVRGRGCRSGARRTGRRSRRRRRRAWWAWCSCGCRTGTGPPCRSAACTRRAARPSRPGSPSRRRTSNTTGYTGCPKRHNNKSNVKKNEKIWNPVRQNRFIMMSNQWVVKVSFRVRVENFDYFFLRTIYRRARVPLWK